MIEEILKDTYVNSKVELSVWQQQHDGRDVTAGCIRRMDWKGKGGLNNE